MEPGAAFWRGKRVLVTGHTGFKGGWLTLWLRRLGATVTGISLPPATTPDLFTLARAAEGVGSHLADIRDREAVARIIRQADPQAVFHLAAQPLVRPSYDDPIGTFSTNVMGTAHVLDALRFCPGLRVVVAITTDKVYRNREWPFPYREDDHLGGHDPYSASKAGSEIVAACYRDAFFKDRGVALATARAGNVIGGGDWSLDRLIPDAVRAFGGGGTLHIRRPDAVRPWQHVLEPLAGYLRLASLLFDDPGLAGAYNFGPHTSEAATVRQVVELARAAFGGGEVAYGPGDEGPHEAGWLALETAKARTLLGVRPLWSLEEAVGRTMAWYARQLRGQDARELCLEEIAAYEALLRGAA
jgi:CDP-glucose 4,6-dehydratase